MGEHQMNLIIQMPQETSTLVVLVLPESGHVAHGPEAGAVEYDSWNAGVTEYESWSRPLSMASRPSS
jgi:hypothetical protein